MTCLFQVGRWENQYLGHGPLHHHFLGQDTEHSGQVLHVCLLIRSHRSVHIHPVGERVVRTWKKKKVRMLHMTHDILYGVTISGVTHSVGHTPLRTTLTWHSELFERHGTELGGERTHPIGVSVADARRSCLHVRNGPSPTNNLSGNSSPCDAPLCENYGTSR